MSRSSSSASYPKMPQQSRNCLIWIWTFRFCVLSQNAPLIGRHGLSERWKHLLKIMETVVLIPAISTMKIAREMRFGDYLTGPRKVIIACRTKNLLDGWSRSTWMHTEPVQWMNEWINVAFITQTVSPVGRHMIKRPLSAATHVSQSERVVGTDPRPIRLAGNNEANCTILLHTSNSSPQYTFIHTGKTRNSECIGTARLATNTKYGTWKDLQ